MACVLLVVEVIQRGKYSAKRQVNMATDLQQVSSSCLQLQDMLHIVIAYVDDVIAGKKTPDNATGRFLMGLVNSVPKLDGQALEDMLNSNMKVSQSRPFLHCAV